MLSFTESAACLITSFAYENKVNFYGEFLKVFC